jgi:hypothetical protein
MPNGGFVLEESYVATADMRTKQYYCVKFATDDKVALCNGAADVCVGILQTDPNTNEVARVAHLGRVMAAVDGTTDIAVNDWLGPNTAGVLVKKATEDFSICAVACKAVTTNGVINIEVLFLGPRFFRSAAG